MAYDLTATIQRLKVFLGWKTFGVPQSAGFRESSEVQNIAAAVNYNVASDVSTHSTRFDWVRSNLLDMQIGTPAYLPQPKSDTPTERDKGIIDVRSVMYEQRSR